MVLEQFRRATTGRSFPWTRENSCQENSLAGKLQMPLPERSAFTEIQEILHGPQD